MSDNGIFEYPGGIPLPPVCPGHTLASELAARGLTANALPTQAGRLRGVFWHALVQHNVLT
jgi:hypothetical protein